MHAGSADPTRKPQANYGCIAINGRANPQTLSWDRFCLLMLNLTVGFGGLTKAELKTLKRKGYKGLRFSYPDSRLQVIGDRKLFKLVLEPGRKPNAVGIGRDSGRDLSGSRRLKWKRR